MPYKQSNNGEIISSSFQNEDLDGNNEENINDRRTCTAPEESIDEGRVDSSTTSEENIDEGRENPTSVNLEDASDDETISHDINQYFDAQEEDNGSQGECIHDLLQPRQVVRKGKKTDEYEQSQEPKEIISDISDKNIIQRKLRSRNQFSETMNNDTL